MTKEPVKTVAKEPVKAPSGPTRRRLGRGSTRRITRALTKFDEDIAAFTKEIDLQFYVADDKGERVDEWGFIKELREIRAGVADAINAQLYPDAEEETGK